MIHQKRNTELALDIATAVLFAAFLLSMNPASMRWIRTQLQWMRWYAWDATAPAWLKEALLVRGRIT